MLHELSESNNLSKRLKIIFGSPNTKHRSGIFSMFIAMNRFKIVPGKEDAFEKVWKNRDSHLKGVPGFIEFNLIKERNPKNFHCMPLIQSGNQKMHLLLGQNLKHLDWLTRMQDKIKICI